MMRKWCCFLSIIISVFAQDQFEDRRSKLPYIADAIGNTLPPPANGLGMVGSPSNLLTPDRYEFYTFDDSGELVKRLMTLEEIQAIVAAGDGTDGHLVTFANDDQPPITFNFSQAPFTKVHSVVANVQNVLKAQMEAQKNNPPLNPSLDTPDVSDSWSLILPTIFGNTGGDIIHDISPSNHISADTDVLEHGNPNNDDAVNSLSKESLNTILSSEATPQPSSYITEGERITQKVQLTEPSPKTTSTTTTTTTSTTTTSKPRTTSTTARPKYTTTTTFKPKSTTKTYTIKTNPTSTTKKVTSAYKNPEYSFSPSSTTTAKSTSSTSTTTSTTTTTAKPRATSTTSTTTTTTTPIPSTTSTTTAQPRTTSTTSTTNAPKVLSTTFLPKSSTSTTTEKPRSSTTSEPKITTSKPIFGVKKPSPTTSLPTKINLQTTEKPQPQNIFNEMSGNYIPVSTMTRGTTEKNTFKTTEYPVKHSSSFATTKRYVTLSRGTTASPSTTSTTKPHPLVSTYTPNMASTTKIITTNKPVYIEKNENVTTVTTQSVSPSTTISTTEYMELSKKPVDVIQQDEPAIPIFDMAESISQIASDLGNYQGPTTVDASKLTGSNLELESKENLEIDIPNDTKTDKLGSDSFVKLSTVEPQPSSSESVSQKLSSTTNIPDTLNSGDIDLILSLSMDDVMSQVFHQIPQTIVQTNRSDLLKPNASLPENGIFTLNVSKESFINDLTKFESTTKGEKQISPNVTSKNPFVESNKLGLKSENTTSKPFAETESTKKESLGPEVDTIAVENISANKSEIMKVEITTKKTEMQKVETVTKGPVFNEENYTKVSFTNYYTSSKPQKQDNPTNSYPESTKSDILKYDTRTTTTKPILHKEDTINLSLFSKNKLQSVNKPIATDSKITNKDKVNVTDKIAVTDKPHKYTESTKNDIANISLTKTKTNQPNISLTLAINNVTHNAIASDILKNNQTVESNSIVQPQKVSDTQHPDQNTSNVMKAIQNQTKTSSTTPTNPTINFIQIEKKEKPELLSTEKVKPYIEIKNKTEPTEKYTTDSNPKVEEFKKKIQKVNIDDKELANIRNNSWKLIPTVPPPKTNDQQEKTKTDSLKQEHADGLHKDINLDVSKENQGLEVTTKDLGEDIVSFTELCNELAFRYWSEITKEIDKKRSFVLSPYSVTSMLAMMFMGARGATSGEMNDILKLDDMVTFNPHFTLKNISDSIETSPNEGVATSAFVRELYSDRNKGKILTFYKERAHHFYGGHVEEVNFKLISDIIRRRTNLLIKRHTWGRIVEYMKANSVTMQPPLAAFSANIFQTDCTGSSVDGRDGEMYFVVSPSVRQRRLVPVPAVVYRSGFLAGYDPVLDATAAALGNTNSIISTLFLMPGQQGNVVHADDLEALEKRLLESNPTTPTWNRLLRTLLPRIGLELQIPRFSHKSVVNVTETLKKMGLKDLFAPEIADLGGLNGPTKELYLSDMIQHTTFTTCGEGIVADQHHIEEYPEKMEVARRRRTSRWASNWDEPRDYQRAFHDPHDVSDAMNLPLHLRPRQARLPSRNTQPARLKFDRPFLFFVRHNPSGMILYVGRYNPRLLP